MATFEEALSDDGAETLTQDPTDGGQVADEGAADSGEQPTYLDLEANHDTHVKVTVDGQEVDVPLNEALAGYSRQADYTRKTQELAQERERLQYAEALAQAYDRNPVETARLLAQQAGLTVAEAEAAVQAAEAEAGDDWADDPRLSMLEQRIQQFEQAQARSELESTIGRLQDRYGDDFNATEVVNQALAAGSTDLEGVYKQMAFDRLFAMSAAQADSAAAKAQADAQAEAAKAAVGQVVQSGGSAAGASGDSASSPTSIIQALAMAEQELGFELA